MTFANFKKARIVRSGWLDKGGRRLDCNPYMSGALEAQDRLQAISVRKDNLKDITLDIFNGPKFARIWVDDPRFGVPFLSGSDVLHADLSRLPYLKKDYAESDFLSHLKLAEGMTLVTCSGTIGRMAYVRSDMAGISSSQHVMKINPDPAKVQPGYLYSFLSSKFGVPLIVSGTHGSIIQHIEPKDIQNIQVPRLGDVENEAHDKVTRAANLLVRYAALIQRAREKVLNEISLFDPSTQDWMRQKSRFGWAQLSVSSESFRAYNYDLRAEQYLEKLRQHRYDELSSLCDPKHFKGHIVFKRIDSDPEYGYRLVGQRDAFQMKQDGRWISKASVKGLGLVVPPGTVLIPSHGTLGEFELYCRAVFVTKKTSEYAYSGDFYRCIPIDEKIRGGYLYAFLSTKIAFRLLRAMSTGGKQQYQHPSLLARMPIPRLDESIENQIADWVDEASKCFDQALDLENEARSFVENAIDGAQ